MEFTRRRRHKLEGRWENSVILGVGEHTTEKIVGAADGIFALQPIRQKPEGERYSAE
jgi:hypothetical protein